MNHRTQFRNVLFGLLALASAWSAAGAQQVITLPGADQALSGQPQNLFTVGKEEGQDWEVFSFVPSVAFDGTGNLYVVDRDNGRVLVFGTDGRFVRQIGKKGQGPGELGLPVGVTILSDGRVAIFDLANAAVQVFGSDGAYQTLARSEPGFGSVQGGGLAANPQGGVFMMGGNLRMPGPGQPPEALDSVPLLLVPVTAGETRVLFRAPAAKPNINAAGSAGRMEVRVTPPPEFSPSVTWSPLPDGSVAVSWGQNYDVHVMRPQGALGWTLKRPFTARRTSDRDRENAKQNRRKTLESGGGNSMRVESVNGRRTTTAGGALPPQQIEQILANMTFAETVPVVRRLRADREGRIWIERDGGPGQNEYPIDIVAFNGAYVGTVKGVSLPNAFGPDGRAAFIEADDLGVQRVSVRRIPQAWLRPVPRCSPPECR
jgi:hypothetical protein